MNQARHLGACVRIQSKGPLPLIALWGLFVGDRRCNYPHVKEMIYFLLFKMVGIVSFNPFVEGYIFFLSL